MDTLNNVGYVNSLYMFSGLLVGIMLASFFWQIRVHRLQKAWAEISYAALKSVDDYHTKIKMQDTPAKDDLEVN